MYLIVGGDSVVGSLLSKYWRRLGIKHDVTTRSKALENNKKFLDLEDLSQIDSNFSDHYESVVICAGITSRERCKNFPEETRKINVESILKIANHFNLKRSKLIYISSSKVFSEHNNYPSSPRSPIDEYGLQKAEVEEKILGLENTYIVRSEKIVHKNLPIFKKWLDQIKSYGYIEAYSNLYIKPVKALSLIKLIHFLVINNDENKIHHAFGEIYMNYSELANEFFKKNIKQNFEIKEIDAPPEEIKNRGGFLA